MSSDHCAESKNMWFKSGKELQDIRESLIAKCKHHKFAIPAKVFKKNVNKKAKFANTKRQYKKPTFNKEEKYDEDEKHDDKQQKGTMFSDVESMKCLLNIKNTALEKELKTMEKQLVAAKHVSRKCQGKGCKETAPNNYPNNTFLCGKHRQMLRNKLQCVIPCGGSQEEKQKCRELKLNYEGLCQSITTDTDQSLNKKDLYPSDYFTVSLAKLLFCRQQLDKVDTSQFDDKCTQRTQQLKEVVDKLMDLLIAGRQKLNCFWHQVFEFIINLIHELGITADHIGAAWTGFNTWIVTHPCYIFALYSCIVVLSGAILYFLIFGDANEKKMAGCAAIGMGIGAVFGGPAGAVVGGLLGGGIGALLYN